MSGRVVVGLAAGTLVAAPLVVQRTGRGCWRLLDNPVLRWLGARSYSFYLVHFAVLVGLAPLVASAHVRVALLELAALALPATALIAAVSYRFVERPALRRKARASRPAAEPAVSSAPAR